MLIIQLSKIGHRISIVVCDLCHLAQSCWCKMLLFMSLVSISVKNKSVNIASQRSLLMITVTVAPSSFSKKMRRPLMPPKQNPHEWVVVHIYIFLRRYSNILYPRRFDNLLINIITEVKIIICKRPNCKMVWIVSKKVWTLYGIMTKYFCKNRHQSREWKWKLSTFSSWLIKTSRFLKHTAWIHPQIQFLADLSIYK